MFKRILIAYNSPVSGRNALLTSRDIAALTKADIHLVAVVGLPIINMFLTEGLFLDEEFNEKKKYAQAILDEGTSQMMELGLGVTGHLAFGEPVEEICRIALSAGCDLIVLGDAPKRVSFAERWGNASVGKSLLEHSPCPVLIAKPIIANSSSA